MTTIPPCVVDGSGCIVCPEVPPAPAIPPLIHPALVSGWGTGANSIAQLIGDMHTTFYMNTPNTAVVIGFKSVRDTAYDPTLIEHGLSFAYAGSVPVVYVIEYGVAKTSPRAYVGSTAAVPGSVFTIDRIGTIVTYYINNIPFYISTIPSVGPQLVCACPYASGDEVL